MRALRVTTLACLVVPAACGGGDAGSARQPGSHRSSLVYYETYDPRSLDLAEPLAIFPKFLAMPVAAVVPAPLSPQADLGQHPVGTGPWRFVAWQHDDYLVFARNPDYWGGAPAADTLTVRIIPEPLTRAA